LSEKHSILQTQFECRHPLATANGSASCGDVARNSALDAFTLPSLTRPAVL
jgi:hypothetical protein